MNEIKYPTIVLFDMDGTTVRHINPRLLHLAEFLDDFTFNISQFFSRFRFRKARVTHGRRRIRPKLIVHRALHKIRRKSVEQIVEPCDGIYDVLDYLKGKNIPMGIVSNGLGKGYGHDILARFDMEKYFLGQVFVEDITRSKPNPEPLFLALEKMGLKPQAQDVVWYVGDRKKDILAALAAQQELPCTVEAFAYGLDASFTILEKSLSPDRIFYSLLDMELLLQELEAEKSAAVPA
ncbi:MAG: HAD-IA family hydrolase [Alphaproteobacteria bacterium]|nr:HAD-IA family hydrolase [Alphaproteobacteria bacterium]